MGQSIETPNVMQSLHSTQKDYHLCRFLAREEPFARRSAAGLDWHQVGHLTTAWRHHNWACMRDMVAVLLKWRAIAGLGQHNQVTIAPHKLPMLHHTSHPTMPPVKDVLRRLISRHCIAFYLSKARPCCCPAVLELEARLAVQTARRGFLIPSLPRVDALYNSTFTPGGAAFPAVLQALRLFGRDTTGLRWAAGTANSVQEGACLALIFLYLWQCSK